MKQLDDIAQPTLRHRLLWEAIVDVEEMRSMGHGAMGERRIVPITGGEFRGGSGLETFCGSVLPGGADRQLARADGAKELDALYEMEVSDGTLLTIRNRVIIDESNPGPRYAMSRIEVYAPNGPWAWLTRRLIVGTLQTARPARAAVIIRGWEIDIE